VEAAMEFCLKNLKNKKAIINVKKSGQPVLEMGAACSVISTRRRKKSGRPSRYPTEDGLNFTGIDFPTHASQINKLEEQNPSLAINAFGWEKDRGCLYELIEKEGSYLTINLMLIQDKEKTHYTYIRRLNALVRPKQEQQQKTILRTTSSWLHDGRAAIKAQNGMHGADETSHRGRAAQIG